MWDDFATPMGNDNILSCKFDLEGGIGDTLNQWVLPNLALSELKAADMIWDWTGLSYMVAGLKKDRTEV